MLQAGERLDRLGRGDLGIIQRSDGTGFGLDAVLLSHFARVPRGGRAIDLGTGTGIIALLLSALTEASRIDALELDPGLAEMAARSVALNGIADRICVRQGDLRCISELYPARVFAAVISNPPYFSAKSGSVSPQLVRASSRTELTCTFADVCSAAAHLVGSRGRFYFVYRPERLIDALAECRRHHLEPKRLRLVQPAPDRPPTAALVAAAPNARPGLAVEPTLTVRINGEYSPEIKRIYGSDMDAPKEADQ